MTAEELKQLKAAIVMTAAYYRDQFDDNLVKLYASDLEDLPLARVLPAFEAYRRNPRNRKPPLPADIRNLVAPPDTDEDIARDASARILAAVSKRGRYWGWGYLADGKTCYDGGVRTFTSFEVAVIEELGEAGARVVEKLGGWQRTHEFVSGADLTKVNAQLRDLALTSVRRARAGTEPALSLARVVDAPTALEAPGVRPVLLGSLVESCVRDLDRPEDGK